ncbi:hypothetical protein AA0113_g12237 [Alternaria arborescens]|uniref:Heme haloperoxidase family profile domain-containing protein n=1 Tax=Alternaria arborescens TaxID=156630 RepID=A0A4Q4PXU7_9PLEO|nr:hypothetical protein AA0112_g9441 [Alternaria arborescens]RYO27771.1 hypothetical protein AA0113_g12237 [Alternaria arborescens]
MHTLSLVLLQASAAVAYPWVSGQPGVNSGLFRNARTVERRQANCPFNPVHKGAAPYTAPYTYTGAKNGVPGSQKGGIKVPADGDTAHAYTPPGPNDIRGPCPGLNAAANHNFLSHDGITNFQELVDAQQNVYNVGYDLAVLLAVLGIEAGGDVLSGRLSIGCDATSRTATLPLLGTQPGLDGHNKFEADSSLTRNDFFLANGDNYSFNGTLFAEMKAVADKVSGGNFDRNALAAYRSQRYEESVQESFFGAVEDSSAPGGWRHVPERIPDNWFSRVEPYKNMDVTNEILAQYLKYPKLFGGNVGTNNFDALSTPFDILVDGKLPNDVTAAQLLCLLYQLGVMAVPSTLSTVTDITGAVLNFGIGKLNPVFKNAGCPLKVG